MTSPVKIVDAPEDFLKNEKIFNSAESITEFLERTTDLTDQERWFEIARLLYTGIECPANKDVAISIWKQLADLDYADAHAPLGELLIRGDDLPLDIQQGITHLEQAAKLGHHGSLRTLISLYQHGFNSIEADPHKALEYMKYAAECGDTERMLDLSTLLASPPYNDASEAFKYAEMAAQAEDPRGHYNVGRAYERGIGVSQDLEKAFFHYDFAAKRGIVMAQHNMAALYANGTGVEQDYEQARLWYMIASVLKSYMSMQNLGVMSENGQGDAENPIRACAWYQLASEAGSTTVDQHIKRLMRDFTEEQIKEEINQLRSELSGLETKLREDLPGWFETNQVIGDSEMEITESNASSETATYRNWVEKAELIGFTSNQIKGLALLYQWRLTYIEHISGRQVSSELFTGFVTQELAEKILPKFSSEDFFKAVPILRAAGQALNTALPEKRVDNDGLPTDLFDFDATDDDSVIETLGPRHEFDLWLLEELGTVLNSDASAADYFVLAQHLTELGHEHDWEGFRRIQLAIALQPSPIVMSFTDHDLVTEISQFEPLEIALRHLGYGKTSIAEITWNASKSYLYEQTAPFLRINQELEFEDASQFILKIMDKITPYIAGQMNQNPNLQDEIGDEYLSSSFQLIDVWQLVEKLIEEKFSALHLRSLNRPSTLLVNAIIHNELCHVIMKNVNSWYESEAKTRG